VTIDRGELTGVGPREVDVAWFALMSTRSRLAADPDEVFGWYGDASGEPLDRAAVDLATLLHGDLKVANVGFDGRRTVMLDWGTLTGTGPPAVEHAWYWAVNGAAVDASLDDLLADAAALLGSEDRRALPLALLGALLQLGWEKALGATSDDPAVRARERARLAWWWERAKEALEAWSPA
jgi:aminoglycoside phosphotransferase (APT) family kinase protein